MQEYQSMYEETQRQLQITLDQYGVAQRRLQTLSSEFEEMRANMEAVTHDLCSFDRPLETMSSSFAGSAR